jgi:Fe-S cluster assembly scaffold protein SufB
MSNTISSFQDTSTSTLFNTTSQSTIKARQAQEDLEKLEKQLQEMQRIKAEQAKIGEVVEYQKNTNDLAVDNNMTARDVGLLKKNQTRLNVFSALAKGDQVDTYKFRVTQAGDAKIGMLNASGENDVRVQIFKKGSTTVVADSGAADGTAAKKAFGDAGIGALNLDSGDYVVRITRANDSYSAKNSEYSYALQLSMGTYTADYDTIEKAVDPNADPFGFSANVGTTNLISMMSTSYSFISSLQPIGSSATSKMQTAIYDALF